MRSFGTVIMLIVVSGTANADISQVSKNWYCGSLIDWQSAQIFLNNRVVLNNFMVRERRALMAKKLKVIEVSYSAINRSSDPIAFNSQVSAFDDKGLPIFSVEANPTLDLLSDSATQTLSGDSYFGESSLSDVKKLCIGFFADI